MSAFSISLQQPMQPVQKALQGGPVRVETSNFVVRSLTAADVTPGFARWFDDALMLQGLNLPALHFSVEGLRAFVASFNNLDNYFIGVLDKRSQNLQGFYNFSVNRTHRVATLTMGMAPHTQMARQILWEVSEPLFDEMFSRSDIEKISARVLASNRRVLFALANNEHFVPEALLRQECLGVNGKRLDVLAIACFKDPALRPPKRPLRRPEGIASASHASDA
ncbi:hypothetical protein [Comamonas odontotermitis]|uniref:hypothetical protein n=1 Tax=Comamonas odontotermitis TaxID=379895 RepID=UPI001CC67E89|nr:hypothetical protein [Comamonas odontotermitis]UBB15760.1 hypothetical protein LAD35_12935 [Comamonas odontotermitis]